MTRNLIPRSDNVSAKVVEASDFEKYFCFVQDHIVSGLELSAGSGLAVNIASGIAKINGLYIDNTITCSIGSLTASDVNYIYATLSRCASSEPQSWSFTSNVSGTLAADSILLGTATTDGSSVTAVDNLVKVMCNGIGPCKLIYGSGADGSVVISTNTALTSNKFYKNLTVNACVTLTGGTSPQIINVTCTLTVNGTITMTGQGAAGGAVGGGAGGAAVGFTTGGGAGGDNVGTGGAAGSCAPVNGAGNPGVAGSGTGAGGGGGSENEWGNGTTSGGTAGSSVSVTGGAGGAGGTVSTGYDNILGFLGSPENIIGAGGGGGASGAGGGTGGQGGNAPNTSSRNPWRWRWRWRSRWHRWCWRRGTNNSSQIHSNRSSW